MLTLLVSTYLALAPVNSVYPPVLDCIVQHESGGRQFSADGSVLTSSTHDYGVMQINARWLSLSKAMGLDILNSEADNVTFGIYLYNKYGPTQWATYKHDCIGVAAS